MRSPVPSEQAANAGAAVGVEGVGEGGMTVGVGACGVPVGCGLAVSVAGGGSIVGVDVGKAGVAGRAVAEGEMAEGEAGRLVSPPQATNNPPTSINKTENRRST